MAFTVVATEDHVFSVSDPADYASYLVPGNGGPAVSTSSYYNMQGLYNMRCYDLDTMGSPGAAVKAAQGGKRYVWVTSADHPNISYGWRGQNSTVAGFSHQPWDFPRSMYEIIRHNNAWTTTAHPAQYQFYEFPYLFYNPDDPDGKWFYVFGETGPDHFTGLWRSSDFISWAPKELSHFHVVGSWSSFLRYAKRLGAGSYQSLAFSTAGAAAGAPYMSIWTSTDAITWATTSVKIVGTDPTNGDGTGRSFMHSEIFTVAGQTYAVGKEETSNGAVGLQYGTIFPIDPVTFDKLTSPAITRFTTKAFARSIAGKTVGWEYLQEVSAFYEDGLLFTWPTYGFPSDVNTAALSSGLPGVPYANGGGLDQQFLDKVVVRCDDTLAAAAAPVGVAVSCNNNVVTISWKDALPANTYRVYRGTTATTQATLVGDVAGTSTTDSPVTNTRYWYKVVTLQSGTERKSRVLSVFVSSASVFINEHVNRVLDDGGDIATINISYLKRVDAMLTSAGIRNTLEFFTHPAFGMKTGSTLKIYDVGCTRLPRGEDFKAFTANTTYNPTLVNSGPCWVNSTNNAYGYWGNTQRGNAIHRKRQITIIAAYLRTQTTEDLTFVGTGPVWGSVSDGTRIIKLTHKAGTPGTIEFSLSDETGSLKGPPHSGTASTKTASVAANGTGLQIAIGTYDGTSMRAYSNTTSGTAVTTLDPNPDFGSNATWIEGSLAGARQNDNNGTYGDIVTVGGVGAKQIFPFLCSGSIHAYSRRYAGFTSPDDNVFGETHAKGAIQAIMVLEGAVNSTQVGQIVSFLNEQVTQVANAKNLVTDFGAVADGQRVTGATASLAVGTNVLTVGTPLFSTTANAEVGKTVSIYWDDDGQGPHYFFHYSVITASTSTTLTLATSLPAVTNPQNNPTSLSSTTNVEIRWGTDNKNAFMTGWLPWAQTQTDPLNPPVLQIPDGHYCLAVGGTDTLNLNVQNPKWVGLSGNADACILSQLYVLGEMRFGTASTALSTSPLDIAGANSARLQTATAGQSTVTLVDSTNYGSRIQAGRACLIGGFDVQSNGYPPNNQFFEWNYITSYSSGVVTLRNPLTQDYKSTWPTWVGPTTGNCDYGGPATIWVMPAGFDTTVELNDFTILAINGSNVITRDAILRRIKMIGFGTYPTQMSSFYADTCVWPQSIEVDKMVGQVTFNNCTVTRNWQQSTSPNRMIINGGTLTTLDTARYTEANNVTFTGIGKIEMGTFYGRAEKLVMNNCSGIAELTLTGATLTDLTNFTWAAGKLRYLKSAGNVVGWMSPGSWVGFNNNKYFDQVTDVTADATYVYFTFAKTTNWPLPTHTQIGIHAMPDLTVRGCTGTLGILPDWNNAPANAPIYSYSIRSYVGGPTSLGEYNSAFDKWPEVWGRPLSIKSTVNTVYTGAGALTFKHAVSTNWGYVTESDGVTHTDFGATINMKTAGLRTMSNGAAPTGAVTGDVLFNFAATGSVWFYDNASSAPGYSANITNGEAPAITIEWVMDQGLSTAVAPPVETRDPIAGPIGLRFRGG